MSGSHPIVLTSLLRPLQRWSAVSGYRSFLSKGILVEHGLVVDLRPITIAMLSARTV